ncbi:MAG: glycosyltransferase [Desulfobacteraceae bacterium]|nr:glycosyltransferase [Desulfobacteraceae bacterium]
METYCQDYLSTDLPFEFNITFCRAILIKSVFTTRGLLRFTLRLLNSLSITFVWIATLLTKRPDIAHVHTNSYAGFYIKGILTLLAKLVGAKTVLHIHGGGFKEFYGCANSIMRRLIRCLISANCAVIVLSKRWYEFFESIGIPGKRMVVMTNSVFLPDIPESKHASDSDELTVLFMSRLERDKGIHELADVIERRSEQLQKCRFVLAGPKSHDWDAVARRSPSSAHKFGLWAWPVRRFICRRIFKYAGKKINVEKGAYFGDGSEIEIGDYSGIGVNCQTYGPIKIGNDVMMGPEVVILTENHRFDQLDIPMRKQGRSFLEPVTICDDVWVGTRVIILPGVTVNHGAVIGAGAIVTKDVPEYAIVAGNPAKIMRKRTEQANA